MFGFTRTSRASRGRDLPAQHLSRLRSRFGVEVLESRDVPATFTWTGEGNNTRWDNVDNWDTKAIPQSGDVADIYGANAKVLVAADVSGVSVILRAGTLSVDSGSTLNAPSFAQSGGVVDGAGILKIQNGRFEAGSQRGSGVTVVQPNGKFQLGTGTNTSALIELAESRTLRAEGGIVQESKASLRLADTSVLQVAADGLYTIQDFTFGSVQSILAGPGSGMKVQIDAGGRFVNEDNDDTFQIDAPVVNRGTLEAIGQAATILIQNVSDLGGTIRIAPTSTVKISPWSSYPLPDGGTESLKAYLGSDGGLRVESIGGAGGKLALSNAVQLSGNLTAANGANVTVTHGTTVTAGSGDEDIGVTGGATLTTTSATFNCIGISVAANSTWNIEGGTGSNNEFNNVSITNSGTTNWNGSDLVLSAASTLTNNANANFYANVTQGKLTAASFTDFKNDGTLRVSSNDEQTVTFGARILNTGTILVGFGSMLDVTVADADIGVGVKSGIVSTGGMISLENTSTLRSGSIFVGGGDLLYRGTSTIKVATKLTVDAGKVRGELAGSRLDVVGDFVLGNGAKVYILASSKTEHNVIAVTGAATIDGSFYFSSVNGYNPSGDVITPITYGSSNGGKFAAVYGAEAKDVAYNAGDITIAWPNEPGPEPEPGPGSEVLPV